MFDWIDLQAPAGFMPHGHCYLWQPQILGLHVGSDALIAIAYFSIPLALVRLVQKRDDLAFNGVFLMFGAFIFLCGLTHAFAIWTTWHPFYEAEGWLKLATALVSLATAVVVWPLLPRALALPSTAALTEANDRYRALNETLEERVADRTRSLVNRNADLERFASFLSHEFRQPLNTLLLNTELLAEDGEPSQQDSLARIRRAGRQMASMIEAELQISRATRDAGPVEALDMDALFGDLVDEFMRSGEAPDASIEVGTLPVIYGDPVQIRQLFTNLLSNAFRYRRSDVPLRVTVEAERHDDQIWIEVADNGQGFDTALAEQIFQPFERGASTDASGVGVGLAICKRIAQRMGGDIFAEGSPGQGARFVVCVPSRARGVDEAEPHAATMIPSVLPVGAP